MRYVFADCELDTQLCVVRSGDTQRPLRPKPLQVLLYLLEHRDRVVPKQELAERLWPDQYISDTVIENSILAARRAVGDSGRAQRIIRTLHGHGYRLIAPVTLIDEQEEASRPEALTSPVEEKPPVPMLAGDGAAQVRSDASSPAIEAARRQLTVLFCDLVGSTELSSQVDPEEYADIIGAYHAACAAVIERYEGHIAQYLGDGLLVYFGYPQTHEDDAQRAVHTALAILESLRQPNDQLQAAHGIQVAVRLGIHTGVVVMSAVGSGGHAESLALGETPNIAARLQALAAANTAVLSAATYRLTHGYFACRALGSQALPGLAEPIELYQVLQASGVASRFAVTMIRGLTPLVGRERERDLLLERWAQARNGNGHVALISGEVGIGKSRLAQALKDQAVSEDYTLLECQGLPYHQHTAFWPLIELLPRVFEWQPDESTTAKLSRMAQASEQAQLPVEQTVPLLAGLLALPTPEDVYLPLALTPEDRRQKTFETLLALICRLAARRPVLFIVEDLHWIDPSTLEFLELLVQQSPTIALFAVITCRPAMQPSWVMRAHMTHVTLDRLEPESVQEMIGLVLGAHVLSAAVRQQIAASTDGVPLFVEEVTKMAMEMDGQDEGSPDAAPLERASILTIPATLHDLLMARLDRLGAARSVAQLASTIGREFSYTWLRALAPWEESTLQLELSRLVEAELLYQRGLPPQATYLFKHALIRDAAYESLLKRTRQQYHRQIADVLEEQFSEIPVAQPELLAYHFSMSEAWDRAFAYLVRSGDKARQVYANQEAITFYTQAVEASGCIAPALDAAQLLPLYEGRGLVWMLLTQYEAAIADFRMMCQTARAAGDQIQEGESLCHLALAHWSTFAAEHLPFAEQCANEAFQLAQRTGDQKVLARSLASLGSIDIWRGNLQEAEKTLEASLQICRREGYPEALAPALMWRGAQAYWQGDFQRAVQSCQEGVPVSRAIYDGFQELMNLAFLCLAHWSAGEYAQAFTVAREGVTKARERENTFILGRLTNTLGWFHHEFGNISQALAYDLESVELGRASDISNVEISALINVGLDHLALGQYEQAWSYFEPTLERVEREASGAHRWRWKIRLLTALANLAYATGAYKQALHSAGQALREAQTTSSQKYIALNWALRGKIAAQVGNAETAESDLQRALALAEMLQSPSLIYPIAYDFGYWRESAGKAQEAKTLYGTAWAMIEMMTQAIGDTALRETLLQSAIAQSIRERLTRLAGSTV